MRTIRVSDLETLIASSSGSSTQGFVPKSSQPPFSVKTFSVLSLFCPKKYTLTSVLFFCIYKFVFKVFSDLGI